MKGKYPQPRVAATKTPKLDDFIKQVVPTASNNANKELAKIQTFVLDAIAPLTTIMEAGNSEDKNCPLRRLWQQLRQLWS